MTIRPARGRRSRIVSWRLLAALVATFAMLPLATPAAAAGSATIQVTSTGADGTTPLPFVRFRVTDSNGTVYGPLEAAPPSGTVTFTVDPVDASTTFTVDMETPPACGIAPDPQTVGPLADGANADLTFVNTFDPNCDLGSISAYAYRCPDGIDGSGTTYATFRDNCVQTQDDVTFTFAASDGSQSWTAVTGDYGIAGRAPLVGLLPGDYTVQRAPLDDDREPVVFCAVYGIDPIADATPQSISRADVSDGEIALDLNHQRIACDFFDVPGYTGTTNGDDNPQPPAPSPTSQPDQGDNGQVVEGGDATGSLEVHLSACEAGYSGSDFYNDCHGNGIPDRVITVDGPSGTLQDTTVVETSPGPGIARFGDLEPGDYTVSEDIPGDVVTYYVFCSEGDANTPIDITYDDSHAEAIVLPVAAGDVITCDWYIVGDDQQQGGGTSLTIVKYGCPDGYDPSTSSHSEFLNDCPDTVDGVKFSLVPETGDRISGTTGDSVPGTVVFTGFAPGGYGITEDIPNDTNLPYAFCSVDGGPFKLLDLGKRVDIIVNDGDQIDCDWFNVPVSQVAKGKITINKWLCPQGQNGNYAAKCTTPWDGIDFQLTGPNGYDVTATTQADGTVWFGELAKGKYTVTELPPGNPVVAVYVVSCSANGQDFPFAYDDATGLRIRLTLPANASVTCDWFNVPPAPAKPGASGSITITKYLCQGRSDANYNWKNDCTNYGAGAGFALTPRNSDTALTGTTNSNGQLVFSKLGNGAYQLDETTGDWCHAEADRVDANGNVLVQNGGATQVAIYNCGKKSVNVLPSTGAGLTQVARTSWTLFGAGVLALLALAACSQRRRVLVALAHARSR